MSGHPELLRPSYDRRTCSQWKSLSNTYLRGFNTVTALHNKYPKRVLHAPC